MIYTEIRRLSIGESDSSLLALWLLHSNALKPSASQLIASRASITE